MDQEKLDSGVTIQNLEDSREAETQWGVYLCCMDPWPAGSFCSGLVCLAAGVGTQSQKTGEAAGWLA